jgi:rhamnose utilization protein RhaD (predicted bifunctional aldolase and dehydrogenase)
MWIKASGAWLGEARDRPIMVGVDLAPMRDAMERGAGE